MATDAQRRASARYNKRNVVQVALALNKATDADVIAHLETVGSKRGYILGLIRADMAKRN